MPSRLPTHCISIYYDTIDKYEDTGNNTEARLGWLGRFNYNYANKYLIDFSARYDGSWKFPPNHRWGFFPSASLGWRISEETLEGIKNSFYFQRFKDTGILWIGRR